VRKSLRAAALGHLWGGMHSNIDDLGIFLQMFLNGGL
jgi:hypothetical protein